MDPWSWSSEGQIGTKAIVTSDLWRHGFRNRLWLQLWRWHQVCRWIRSQSLHATWNPATDNQLQHMLSDLLIPMLPAHLSSESLSLSALSKGTLTTRLQSTAATHGRHMASPTKSRMSWWLIGYGSFKDWGYPMNFSVSIGKTIACRHHSCRWYWMSSNICWFHTVSNISSDATAKSPGMCHPSCWWFGSRSASPEPFCQWPTNP